MQWKAPSLSDREAVLKFTYNTECVGNDLAFANLFLLRHKYNTEICFEDGFLLRRYDGPYNRKGYAFPLGSGDAEEVLKKLEAETSANDFNFCFLSETQAAYLEQLFPDRFEFSSDEDESDYIYRTEDLALFKGRKYHKHKNRAAKFTKSYSDIVVKKIDDDQTAADAWEVEERWIKDRPDINDMVIVEREAIKEALICMEPLNLKGVVVYADGEPAAMAVAGAINPEMGDVLYEKSYGEYALNGAYSAVCRYMAALLTDYKYLNREEDLGFEGLRKSKISYHPVRMHKKYRARSKS